MEAVKPRRGFACAGHSAATEDEKTLEDSVCTRQAKGKAYRLPSEDVVHVATSQDFLPRFNVMFC